MALKQDTGLAKKLSEQKRASAVPLVYKADLDAHRRQPAVRARLRRVSAMIERRAQQKV